MAIDDGDSEQVFRLQEGAVTWREVDGEVVALDLIDSKYLGVNLAGGLLWVRLAAGATRGELIDALTNHFDVTADRARTDVGAFLDDAARRGLLEK